MSLVLVAGTCIIKNNKALILQHAGPDEQDGRWGPPAGHGEKGETLIQTAIRETKEETGLDVKITGITQAGGLSHRGKDYVLVLFSAIPKTNKIIIQKQEVKDYKWVSLSDLKGNKYAFRKKFLKEPMVIGLTRPPIPLDSFKIFTVEKD